MPIVEGTSRSLQESIWWLEHALGRDFDYKDHKLRVDDEEYPFYLEIHLCQIDKKKNIYGFRVGMRPNLKELDAWFPMRDVIALSKQMEDILTNALQIMALLENDVYSKEEFDRYLKNRFKDQTKARDTYFSDSGEEPEDLLEDDEDDDYYDDGEDDDLDERYSLN